MRPKEVVEAFRVIDTNRKNYKGVTIGDIHRAAHLLSNYAACLESFVTGLHQRLDEIQDICKNGPLNMMWRKDAHPSAPNSPLPAIPIAWVEAVKKAKERLEFIEKHSCENPPRCGYESSKTISLLDGLLSTARPTQPPCSNCGWPGGSLAEWAAHDCRAKSEEN